MELAPTESKSMEAFAEALAPYLARALRAQEDARRGKRTITQAEAARELGVSPRTIKRMLLDGRLRKRGRGVEVTSLRTYQQNQA